MNSLGGPHSSRTATTGPRILVDGPPRDFSATFRIIPTTFGSHISGRPPRDHTRNFQAPLDSGRPLQLAVPRPSFPTSRRSREFPQSPGHSASCWAAPPWACQACACPASRLKKEPGVGDRDVSGFMNGGAYRSEARSWSDIPPRSDSRQQRAEQGGRLRDGERGGYQLRGELTSGCLCWLPGKLAEGHAPHRPFDKLSGGDVLI